MIDPDYYPRAMRCAAQVFGVPITVLRGDCRERTAVRARWAVWLCLHRRGHAKIAIGRRAARDHSTVGYAISMAEQHEARSPEFAAMVREVAAA